MLHGLRFYILDVFAESKLSGNQLAVFRDCGGLSSDQMQKIAQEMHFSETTFVTSENQKNGGYDVRIFTPSSELPFAGHPTLGTAYILQSVIIRKQLETVTLNLKVGQIQVSFSYSGGLPGLLWMRQKPPLFGDTFDRKGFAQILGLDSDDFDQDYPIMKVSTGIPFAIVPLKGLKAVRGVHVNNSSLREFLKKKGCVGLLIFSRQTYNKENQLNVRVLGPADEIPEDPATGSGNGCLAGYLIKTGYFSGDSINLRVEQGYEIGRKSLILLRANRSGGKLEVNVGGRVQLIASGEFSASLI